MAHIRRLADGPLNHFFGYYGVNPWDTTGQLHLALGTAFHRRPPNVDDEAQVGVVDRDSGRFTQYGVTRAFNLQQGSMLHWIDAGHGEELTYNVWRDGKVRSLAVEKTSRDEREIDAAIAAVSADGRQAMGLSYDRMYHCRSVVGYANDADPRSIQKTPADDGLFRIDLTTGRSDLILSFTDVIEFARRIPAAAFDGTVTGPVWFNHVVFNTDGSRMFFLCRMRTGSGGFRSARKAAVLHVRRQERRVHAVRRGRVARRRPYVFLAGQAASGVRHVPVRSRSRLRSHAVRDCEREENDPVAAPKRLDIRGRYSL